VTRRAFGRAERQRYKAHEAAPPRGARERGDGPTKTNKKRIGKKNKIMKKRYHHKSHLWIGITALILVAAVAGFGFFASVFDFKSKTFHWPPTWPWENIESLLPGPEEPGEPGEPGTPEPYDGKSRLYVSVVPGLQIKHPSLTSDFSQILRMNKTDNSELSVKWGDGTDPDTSTTVGNITIDHEYSDYGDYIVEIWISDGEGNFAFGNGGNSFGIIMPGLTGVIIGDNVLNIGEWAFYRMDGIRNVTILEGVLNISSNAFNGCLLEKISLSEGLLTIGDSAFLGATTLNKIVVPSTVTNIGMNFVTLGMVGIVFLSETPAIIVSNTFSVSYLGAFAKIYVPDNVIDSYKEAQYWSVIAVRIFPLSERPAA